MFDVLISIFLLIIFIPFFLIISLLIKIDSSGPIIFKQERLGKNGNTFKILKFRSMVVDSEKQGVYESKKDPRVTRIGRICRKLSIDELPQLINILKGDMSIIGDRKSVV